MREWTTARMYLIVACVAVATFGVTALVVGTPAVTADGVSYNASAMRLLNTGVFTYPSFEINEVQSPNAFITPGYVLLLSAVYLFLPHSGDFPSAFRDALPAILALHFVLAVGTVVLAAAVGQRLGGRRLGLASGLIAAAYLPFGAQAMSGWSESAGLFFTMLTLFLASGLLKADQKRRYRWAVAYGLVGALTVMVRPVTALWLLVPLAIVLLTAGRERPAAVRVVVVAGLSITVGMAPWVVRNAMVLERFIPLTTHAGTVWLDSVGGIEMSAEEYELFQAAVSDGHDGAFAVARQRLARDIRQDPLGFVGARLGEIAVMVGSPWDTLENPQSPLPAGIPRVQRSSYRMLSPVVYRTWIAFIGLLHLGVLGLAVTGAIMYRRRVETWLVLSLPLYTALVGGIMGPRDRYFFPAMGAMVVVAAIGLLGVLDRAAQRTREGRATA